MTPIRSIHINTERTWRGGEKQTLLLVSGLRERGHVAELVCQPDSPLEERARAAGITVHSLRMRGEADVPAIVAIRRHYRRGDFQICQMHTSHAHTLGVVARFGRTWPRTVVARRVDFSIYRKGLLRLNYLKYRFGVDRYFAISHAIRDVMVADGIPRERIAVVHSGVTELPPAISDRPSIRTRHGIADDALVIGNVAHLASHKGQIHLIQALPSVLERVSRARLLIVGEGEERERLEQEITRLGIGDVATLAGFQDDVSGYLDAFDVFAMPSIQEGLCTSLLDALRKSLPTVAARTGGIPEIIRDGETGLLSEPGNADDLAAKLTHLLTDRASGQRLADNGRHLVEREFAIDRTIERSLENYEELIAQGKG